MNRRTLLKTLGLSTVGLATVPLWMDSWTEDSLPPSDGLNVKEDQKAMLAELVGVIIPTTDIPGAKDLAVDKYILTMVADCYEKDVQESFIAGFDELDRATKKKYGNGFMEVTDEQKTEIVHIMINQETPPEEKPNFAAFIKVLTIAGYMTSEYVLQNIVKYEFVPSRFDGSFPVDQSILHA